MPGGHCETWARGLFTVWSSPTNFASHVHSVPFSSELYRASFRDLASTMVEQKLTKKNSKRIFLSTQGKKVGYSTF